MTGKTLEELTTLLMYEDDNPDDMNVLTILVRFITYILLSHPKTCLVLIFSIIILTIGETDLIDGMVHYLMNNSCSP